MRGRLPALLGSICLSLLLSAGQSVRASSLTDIDPNPKTITCGDDTLGTLKITKYQADNPGRFGPGATIVAQFTQADPDCNLNLHWIQAIVGGKGTIGQTDTNNDPNVIPYLDPYERDDDLPFYWKEDENNTVGTGKLNATAAPGTLFSDAPSQPATNGNFIKFETALVAVDCKNPLNLYWLAGFTWGYSIAANTSTVDAFSWINGPSGDMTTAVTDFDGTANYVGDGDTQVNNDTGGAGYKFVAGCPTCCVPLPSSGMMTLAGMGGLGLVFAARSKSARAA